MIEFVPFPIGSKFASGFVFRYSLSLEYAVRNPTHSSGLALYRRHKNYKTYRYTRRAGWISLTENNIDRDFFTWDEVYNIVALEIL